MSEAKQNLDKAAREFEQWVRDELRKPVSPPIEYEQPAPESGKWRVGDNGSLLDRRRIYEGNQHVATALSDDWATGIIRDHRLAALVPGLVEALTAARDWWQGESISENDLERQFPLSDIQQALNAVAKEREG